MSSEMVACIAVESLSILEKMHSRGYDLAIFLLLSPYNFPGQYPKFVPYATDGMLMMIVFFKYFLVFVSPLPS